ncbi:agmatine deiminase family protein [Nannocystis bainbridge]|uniref:Agmatine deiminase family protein n=1 Tax=Nannocystis bainbridge TaxID=2995303 RepID=A0ABT5DU51_9BACT|nr:agmatine deiminase family protein [Nannocystis bainbridge]MDC0717177.1 agmatine deiminase family protein [Nannocystis bainbridge]
MAEETRVLPAEWAPQAGVMLTWPHADSDWGPMLARVEPVFVEIARQIALREVVVIACHDAALAGHVRALLRRAGVDDARARLHAVACDDTWARDHGPLTVTIAGTPRVLDFEFNGWGGKFAASRDDVVPQRLHALGAFGAAPLEVVPLILEGGSVESDGEGTILTTERCLLSDHRSGLGLAEVESALQRHLGATRVLWLRRGWLEGDDTDGHIDTLARLCDARTIAYQSCTDADDSHWDELQAMADELAGLRTAAGEPYELVPLPWPRPRFGEDGRRLPATYANFLILDGAVLVPTYDDPADAQALSRLAGVFPGREVVGVDCLPLIEQGGSLHCLTMQLPRPLSVGPSTAA